jgi:hypothetical protein
MPLIADASAARESRPFSAKTESFTIEHLLCPA